MKLKERGFSLVEALIGMAIASGVGLVIMQQQESSMKMQAKNNANQIINSAANIVQTAISNRAICSYSLMGKGPGDSIPSLFDAKVDPSNYANFVVVGPNLVDVGQILPGDVKVDSMMIVTNLGKDYLSVRFNSNPNGTKKMYGSVIVGKKFQIQGEKDAAGKYTSCNSQLDGAVTASRQLACQDIGGGWNGTSCVLNTSPIYHNTIDGTLSSKPYDMIQSKDYSCSNCGGGCNPCPNGWTQGAGSCSIGKQCGFSKWRNCTFTCNKNIGQTPQYGEVILNIP